MVSTVTAPKVEEGFVPIGVMTPSGMHLQEITSPSYGELRTMKPITSSGFPVYPDLTKRLLTANRHPDETVAHVLATCSGYAYSDAKTVGMIMTRMGLEKSECRMFACNVDGMMIRSTAFLVQSNDGKVAILCYRGTEPLNFISWMSAVDVDPERVPMSVAGSIGTFDVHAGFYRNVRVTRHDVVAALGRALAGKSVLESAQEMPNPLQALYITGHSLGGAMAALMAVMLLSDTAFDPITEKLRAVYTFGQPMIGCIDFAKACADEEFLAHNVVRYRYQNDFVPSLPPTLSGAFAHFGQEYRFQDGCWRHSERSATQLSNFLELAATPLSFLSAPLQLLRRMSLRYSWKDHLPQHYVSALTPARVTSEFGD